MEEGLFKKYSTQIQKRNTTKKEIILQIKEETGVLLKEEEIGLHKKQVKIITTSVTKQKLFQKNIEKILQEKGFTLKI